jgi:hypothetical protein
MIGSDEPEGVIARMSSPVSSEVSNQHDIGQSGIVPAAICCSSARQGDDRGNGD